MRYFLQLIAVSSLLLTGCQTTKQKFTPNELALMTIERDRNFTPREQLTLKKADENTVALMNQSIDSQNEMNTKCLPTKIATFEKAQGTPLEKYRKGLEDYIKCTKKLGYDTKIIEGPAGLPGHQASINKSEQKK